MMLVSVVIDYWVNIMQYHTINNDEINNYFTNTVLINKNYISI